MSYNQQKAKQLLQDGYSYSEVAESTEYSEGGVRQANYKRWGVDYFAAFRNRIEDDGIPSRLDVSDRFGNWFAGLFDGEGSFIARVQRRETYTALSFTVKIALRDDDAEVIDHVQSHLGGNVHRDERNQPSSRKGSADQLLWRMSAISDLCEIVVPLFDQYGLRSKKHSEYQIWREGVVECYIRTRGGLAGGSDYDDAFLQEMEELCENLKAERRYD
ncbi:LAGLIDADG family homing endonuclease [Salinibacter ruber]|uniref:LAGLIDADG family homing endonuclease n=1 Tax=Salinibacter ruber TaxID=146919 RepID=UPI002073F7C8|nr:LAGLIDADG family homing endonuclease [Salinibacter ruber]